MSNDDATMSFTDHLGELRTRIIRSGLAVIVGFVVCYILREQILTLVTRPLAPIQDMAADPEASGVAPRWFTRNPIEPVVVYLKLSGYGGVLVALPYIVYQICAFVFPGLKPTERRAVRVLIIGFSILVILGVSTAYFGVFPLVLPYLMKFAPSWVSPDLNLSETLNMLLMGLLAFAVSFQFPLVVLVLVYLELLTPAALVQWRKVAIVIIAFASALLTPAEPISMILMMAPLVLLYEASIWLSYLVLWSKRRSRRQT
jgi:sec-independent protein translocase protein TatC